MYRNLERDEHRDCELENGDSNLGLVLFQVYSRLPVPRQKLKTTNFWNFDVDHIRGRSWPWSWPGHVSGVLTATKVLQLLGKVSSRKSSWLVQNWGFLVFALPTSSLLCSDSIICRLYLRRIKWDLPLLQATQQSELQNKSWNGIWTWQVNYMALPGESVLSKL